MRTAWLLVALAGVIAAVANKEHPCPPKGIKIKVYRDSQCEKYDSELTKGWQKFWDGVDTDTCKPQYGAGTAFDYGCYRDGLHTTYYDGEACNTSKVMSSDVEQWNQCVQQVKIWVIVSLQNATASVL